MLKTRAFLLVVWSLVVGLMLSACAAVRVDPSEVGSAVTGGSWLLAWQAGASADTVNQSVQRGSIYKFSEAYRATEQLIHPSFHYGNCPFSDD